MIKRDTTKKIVIAEYPFIYRDYMFYILTIKGRSPRTVNAYHQDLFLFFRFVKISKNSSLSLDDISEVSIDDLDNNFLSGITLSDIYAFLNYVSSDRDNHAATRARKASSLRSYFNYMTSKANILPEDPTKALESPSIKKSMPKYLTLEESILLLNLPGLRKSARDFCMVTLLLNCGMRLSELVGIDYKDIKNNHITILGKGNKERVLFLNESCLDSIEKCISDSAAYRKDGENALFLSRNGRRISPRRVEQILENYLVISGLSGRGISPHKLRHTAATLMYRHGGADIRVLKEVLGHTNISTTEIYTHVSDVQVDKAMQSNPLGDAVKKR